jgi:curved DNA-binding protein CbpA
MGAQDSEQTYYEVLEISQSAHHQEIVNAYTRAKEAYSPESPALYTMFTKEEAEEIRKLIEEAFLILGNQSKRKEYDAQLLARGSKSKSHNLPDFTPDEAGNYSVKSVEPKKNQPKESGNAEPKNIPLTNNVPDGFAKSRLSVYETNPELEKEIATQTQFDGAFLRKIRQYKNVNIDQLSKETRIGRSYLAALEAEDFSALPAPVFLRGFVIQYARVLGLNETAVANSYMSRVKKES